MPWQIINPIRTATAIHVVIINEKLNSAKPWQNPFMYLGKLQNILSIYADFLYTSQ